MRLRQIAFVAHDLDQAVEDLCAVLGIHVCFRDPGVGFFGLHNALMPVGGNLLEVVAPQQPGTTAGRYLERRGGDGGYMLLFQCDDAAAWNQRMTSAGVRSVWQSDTEGVSAWHYHPADIPGAIVSIDTMEPLEDWHDELCRWEWAGPGWQGKVDTRRTQAFAGVDIQSTDPLATAERWASLFDLDLGTDAAGRLRIRFDNMALRFVEDRDGRGLGIGAVDLLPQDRNAILAEAERRGRRTGADQIELCGVRFNLI